MDQSGGHVHTPETSQERSGARRAVSLSCHINIMFLNNKQEPIRLHMHKPSPVFKITIITPLLWQEYNDELYFESLQCSLVVDFTET